LFIFAIIPNLSQWNHSYCLLPYTILLPGATASIECKLIHISSENQEITTSLRVSATQYQSLSAIKQVTTTAVADNYP